MIRAGFLSEAERQALIGLARDGLAEHRIARRANAIVLLDKGWSCAKVASALLLDDDTVRGWYRAYESDGLNGISSFGHEGSACRLAEDQQRALKNWITARLPRSTKVIGAWIEKNFALSYSRPGLIALLHRLGFDYRKPREAPRHLNEAKQKAFIAAYEKLLNTMDMDEAVVFVDAVHPTHQVHAAGCWAPKGIAIAVEQTTGRQSLNIHGAINLETGQTQILEVAKVNARSLIALLKAVEAAHPQKRRIHVHLDNASYHHAKRVREWLKRQGRNLTESESRMRGATRLW
jgi:transposase